MSVVVKANKGKLLPFPRAVLGRVWLYGMRGAGLGRFGVATFITYFMMLKVGAAFAPRYLASRLSARVCCSPTASIV